MFERILAISIVGMSLFGQSRPLPYPMIWDNGCVVSLRQNALFRECAVNDKLTKQELPQITDDYFPVDYQDGFLWVNKCIIEKCSTVLAIKVEKIDAKGEHFDIGTFKSSYIRGMRILPLKNGKFIGFVQNLLYDKKPTTCVDFAPVVCLSVNKNGELNIVDWHDLGLSKPYYKKGVNRNTDMYNYNSLFDDVSVDPCPIRANDSIILPSYNTGFMFIFSAIDGKNIRTIDFLRIGEDRLTQPLNGAAIIAALPNNDGSLLLLHRLGVDLGVWVSPIQPDGYLNDLNSRQNINVLKDPMTAWNLIDPVSGEISYWQEPESLPKPYIDILLGRYNIRFNAKGNLQKLD